MLSGIQSDEKPLRHRILVLIAVINYDQPHVLHTSLNLVQGRPRDSAKTQIGTPIDHDNALTATVQKGWQQRSRSRLLRHQRQVLSPVARIKMVPQQLPTSIWKGPHSTMRSLAADHDTMRHDLLLLRALDATFKLTR